MTGRLAQLTEAERWQLLVKLASASPKYTRRLIEQIKEADHQQYHPGYRLHTESRAA